MSSSYNHELLWQKNPNKSIHLTITRVQIKTITIQITKIVVMGKINNSFNKNIKKYKGRKMMRMKWIWRKVRMFRMEKQREKDKMEIKSNRIRISRRWRSRIWEICSMIRTCNKNNNQFKTNLMKIMTYLKYLGPYHQIWYTENQKPKGKKGN